MPSRKFYDMHGRALDLDRSLGRGGEGEVFTVPAAPQVVAKIYHSPPDREKAEKIAAMTALAVPELLSISAWPTHTLHGTPGGAVIGFLMPHVQDHKEVHALYSPAQRKRDFPNADWAFLVHAAENVARAFANVHHHGHVIGDVNQGNVVVSRSATVKLIDCDSFQITARGRFFPCEVGVAHFTPPELQGKTFRGVTRTENHDLFGLAVLLFHLLFMGRHPFAGRFSGHGDMPLEKAISENRFAYGRQASSLQMSPPPHVLTLAQVTSVVGDLFERAFAPSAWPARPTAKEWISALSQLKAGLRTCGHHGGHRYAAALAGCPWCAIEKGGGPDFFVAIAVAAAAGPSFDLDRFWRDVEAISAPPQALSPTLVNPPVTGLGRPLPAPPGWVQPLSTAAGVLAVVLLIIALAGTATSFLLSAILGLVWFVSGRYGRQDAEKVSRRRVLEHAEAAHRAAVARWSTEAKSIEKQFFDKKREIYRLRDEYREIPAAYHRDLTALKSALRERQLTHFLERFLVEHASIRGLGWARKDALASFGIETAADVAWSSVMQVPGFGPKLTNELLAWRSSLEGRFIFNPNAGIDPADIAALDRKYAVKRQALARTMSEGAAQLRRLGVAAGYPVLQAAETEVRNTGHALVRAKADAAAC